jgi:hypothetical protein
MSLETLLQFVERLLTRRPPRVIAGTFLTSSMAIVLIGYLRGSSVPRMFLTLLAAVGVSLTAFGLRWIEKRCPDTDKTRRVDS